MVQYVPLENGDAVLCDEEALLKPDALERGATSVEGILGPVVGRFIVIGPDDELGDTLDATSSIEDLRAIIEWCPEDALRNYLSLFQ